MRFRRRMMRARRIERIRGKCKCTNPECNYEMIHKAGVPCYKIRCPKCGSPMIRIN